MKVTVIHKCQVVVILSSFVISVGVEGLACHVCTGVNYECLDKDKGGIPSLCAPPEPGNDVYCRIATKQHQGNWSAQFKQCSHMIAGIEKAVPLCQLDEYAGGIQDLLCFCKHDLCNFSTDHCKKDNKVCYDDGNTNNINKNRKGKHSQHPEHVHD